jgi:hypothetical protein
MLKRIFSKKIHLSIFMNISMGTVLIKNTEYRSKILRFSECKRVKLLFEWLSVLFFKFTCADFSKFQRVLRFELQILSAHNLKGLKNAVDDRVRTKRTRNGRSGGAVIPLAFAALEFHKYSKQNRSHTIQPGTAYKKLRGREALRKTISI